MAKRANMDVFKIGDNSQFSKTVSEYDVYGFAGIVGDFYGVHVDEEYAKKKSRKASQQRHRRSIVIHLLC